MRETTSWSSVEEADMAEGARSVLRAPPSWRWARESGAGSSLRRVVNQDVRAAVARDSGPWLGRWREGIERVRRIIVVGGGGLELDVGSGVEANSDIRTGRNACAREIGYRMCVFSETDQVEGGRFSIVPVGCVDGQESRRMREARWSRVVP